MSAGEQRSWCLFASAGDNNAIHLWLDGTARRQWDLVVGYHGDSDHEFSEISKLSLHTFRAKGGKFQILKKFVAQKPQFFDRYSYVWVCDDDIQMSAAQIEEAFSIAESFQFWVAQPALRPEGKHDHPITIYAGPQCDYRAVNFIEVNMPIFRRDTLIEFLAVFDGSLTGWGIDWWYMNVFGAHKLGRFRNFFNSVELGRYAIIDKVPVTNPHDEAKGGREIDKLEPVTLREAAWKKVMAKYGLVEFRQSVFASCTIASNRNARAAVTRFDVARQIAIVLARRLARKFGTWRLFSAPCNVGR
jgi:hypothetical protein